MILSGKEIERRLGGDVVIEPFEKKLLNPNSYNVRLSNKLLCYTSSMLDMKRDNPYFQTEIPEEGYVMIPGVVYLAQTLEYTETTNLVPMLEGRSSVGRLGIFIHATAGFGDVGFKGYWTLELSVTQKVRVYPWVSIGQVFYHTIEGEFEEYSSGKYQKNTGVQPSMMFKDFE